jgi:hypothetical protein
MRVDDNEVAPGSTRELQDVRKVELQNSDGLLVRLSSDKPFDLWLEPVTRTVRELSGYDKADEGYLLVPNIPVSKEGTLAVRLELGASSEAAGDEGDTDGTADGEGENDDAPADDTNNP